MTWELVLGIIAFCLLTEAFITGTEIAIVSADKTRLKMQAEKGFGQAKLALWFVDHPGRFLATATLGTNFMVVIASTVLTIFIIQNYGLQYEGYAFLLVPVVWIFGELLPKGISQHYADQVVMRTPKLFFVVYTIFYPFVKILSMFTDWLFGYVTTGSARRPLTRDELNLLLNASEHPESDVRASERTMVRKVFQLSKQRVERIMIPLVDIKSVSITITREGATEAFDLHGHSKLPVYENRVHNIIGVLHLVDFLTDTQNRSIRELMRPPLYIPQEMRLHSAFKVMRRVGEWLGIVVDEYGATVGLLTLEMILAEIVGDIQDEFELDEQYYTVLGPRHFLVRGRMEIAPANETLGLDIPSGTYKTAAGYLIHHFDRIPKVGEMITIGKWTYRVHHANERSILEIEVQDRPFVG